MATLATLLTIALLLASAVNAAPNSDTYFKEYQIPPAKRLAFDRFNELQPVSNPERAYRSVQYLVESQSSAYHASKTNRKRPEKQVIADSGTNCGLPSCSATASKYTFRRGYSFFCENEMGTNKDSRSDRIVALPQWWPVHQVYKLCGKELEITWNSQTHRAVIGDRCGPGCVGVLLVYAAKMIWIELG